MLFVSDEELDYNMSNKDWLTK